MSSYIEADEGLAVLAVDWVTSETGEELDRLALCVRVVWKVDVNVDSVVYVLVNVEVPDV